MKSLTIAPAIALLLALPASPTGARAESQAAVEITFDVGAKTGSVKAALYDSRIGYDSRKPLRTLNIPANGRNVVARFEGLKPGTYAVQAFHDLNGDGRLNTNLVGYPIEPFAFSNNAPPRVGPAPWSAAAFEVGAKGAAQTLTIR